MANLLKYNDYIEYLHERFNTDLKRTGIRRQAAQAVKCHTTFMSQVLNQKANLNLEQADLLNDFLGHSSAEAKFFLLLVQRQRSGTKRLQDFFSEQIDEIRKEDKGSISRQLSDFEELQEQKAKFYSSWIFGAIHILLTIPKFQTNEAIAKFLNLPLKQVNEALDFLVRINLATYKDNKYSVGVDQIHLDSKSTFIQNHHRNWMSVAMSSIDREKANDLHYSGVISLSGKDSEKLREILSTQLKKNLAIVKESPSEECYVLRLDFFDLKALTVQS